MCGGGWVVYFSERRPRSFLSLSLSLLKKEKKKKKKEIDLFGLLFFVSNIALWSFSLTHSLTYSLSLSLSLSQCYKQRVERKREWKPKSKNFLKLVKKIIIPSPQFIPSNLKGTIINLSLFDFYY